MCTYIVVRNTEGEQSKYKGYYVNAASADVCKDWCDTTPGTDGKPCAEVDWKSGVCFMYTETTSLYKNSPSNHYIRQCTPGPMNAIIGAKFNETSGRAYWFDSDSPFEYNNLVSDHTAGGNNLCVAFTSKTRFRWEYIPCSGFKGMFGCEIPF
ncbi:uncharacterized protein LOC121377763 [Gigantopelta aegis]|uniref:uncharacterized protein LOC121377763 n=1 Tax=Gigantopelta aegis TaxID=1735272 RepID=UPI001B88BD75|nr:uncharacterized protein LOC121377763 [Gigantopelta aegis]